VLVAVRASRPGRQQSGKPGLTPGNTAIAGATYSQGGSAAMKWLLFLLAFAGALAVGFFGVLGLV
jgi:hypothetical protein